MSDDMITIATRVYPVWLTWFRDSEDEALKLADELQARDCQVYMFGQGYPTMRCYGEYGPIDKWLVAIFDESGLTVGQLVDKAGVMPEGFEATAEKIAKAVGVANWREVTGHQLFVLNELRHYLEKPTDENELSES